MCCMEILIISGLSGGGKSKAASFLEDMGYYIVDNLPAELMLKFADLCAASQGRYGRVALVFDVRATHDFHEFFHVLDRLKGREGVTCRLLFLEASVETIINRYKETRRSHPLQAEGVGLAQAVAEERKMLEPVRRRADFVIDSSTFSTAKLRGELLRLFGGGERSAMSVSLVSFGYKYGIPMEADLMFDVRFLPNPYYVEGLRERTGLDREVRDYVFSFRQSQEFMDRLEGLLGFLLPYYSEEGKTVLVIAVGCTGGHHRSVAVTRELAAFIRRLGYSVSENHRDMTRS